MENEKVEEVMTWDKYVEILASKDAEIAELKKKNLLLYNDLADAKGWTRAFRVDEVQYFSELESLKKKYDEVINVINQLCKNDWRDELPAILKQFNDQ